MLSAPLRCCWMLCACPLNAASLVAPAALAVHWHNSGQQHDHEDAFGHAPRAALACSESLTPASFSDSNHDEQAEIGESFFLLALGTAAAFRAGSEQPVGTFKAGAYFGEQALHKAEPRCVLGIA